MNKRPCNLDHLLYFLRWTLGITAAGALLGAIAFPLVGSFLDTGSTLWELVVAGVRNMAFLAFVWAPGTAAVLLYHRIYRTKQSARNDRAA